MKSKANAGHLLKCHTVYFICMLEAPAPRETAKCRLGLTGEYGSLGRQQDEWAIKCKHRHLFLQSQAFDAYRGKHKNGFRAGVSHAAEPFPYTFPESWDLSRWVAYRLGERFKWNSETKKKIKRVLLTVFLSQTGRPRNDLPGALQNSVVVVIITSAKIRANTAKYHR